ncbi:MAG: hypothetical protein LC720_08200, partial [Actinobacteria bacterium]|nr:hypothetical protein [Actinomycetota bacterium]
MPPDQTTTPKLGHPPTLPGSGTILADHYEVIRPLENGLLLGRDTATPRSVVIASAEAGLVPPAAAGLIARHVGELGGIPSLAAPLHSGRDGAWFTLVWPLVHGVSLADRLTHGRLSVPATLLVARDLLGALAGAHARGLLHLGLSPASVTVNAGVAVRGATLTGFGAAVLADCAAAEPGQVDVRYAAPERAGVLDHPVDHRADLYSLGLILHECLTGRPPYAAEYDGELLRRRLTDPPPSLRAE